MIPTFNPSPEILAETLRSVLRQAPPAQSMQIEVIDDCSPSRKTTEIVQAVAGNRIDVHCEPKNLGIARIWNRCVERAKGEYVHILHQDDVIEPGFYQALEAGFRRHPNAGAAFTRHAYADEKGKHTRFSFSELASPGILDSYIEALVTRECIQCAAIAVRRSTYEKIGGFNESLTHALDWEMWIRIASSFPIYYHPEVLASWRMHPDSTTSGQIRSGENIRDIAKAIAIWRGYVSSGQDLARTAARRYARLALDLADYLSRNGYSGAPQLDAALQCDSSPIVRFHALKLRIKWRLRPWYRLATGRQGR
ncbi:glycosyltransferase [Horticoccus sp. 23ND18S-11]|uniref:glycosyltransferase n=1 Tax=Horticoccus sp. 23ND18S-11 TaxID=3391832 RepID=UPI0039C8C8E3